MGYLHVKNLYAESKERALRFTWTVNEVLKWYGGKPIPVEDA